MHPPSRRSRTAALLILVLIVAGCSHRAPDPVPLPSESLPTADTTSPTATPTDEGATPPTETGTGASPPEEEPTTSAPERGPTSDGPTTRRPTSDGPTDPRPRDPSRTTSPTDPPSSPRSTPTPPREPVSIEVAGPTLDSAYPDEPSVLTATGQRKCWILFNTSGTPMEIIDVEVAASDPPGAVGISVVPGAGACGDDQLREALDLGADEQLPSNAEILDSCGSTEGSLEPISLESPIACAVSVRAPDQGGIDYAGTVVVSMRAWCTSADASPCGELPKDVTPTGSHPVRITVHQSYPIIACLADVHTDPACPTSDDDFRLTP